MAEESKGVDFGLGENDKQGSKGKRLFRIGLTAAFIIVFGLAGFLLGRVVRFGPTPEEALAALDGGDGEQQAEQQAMEQANRPGEYIYHDLDPVTVSLSDSRGSRYLRACITLKLHTDDEVIVMRMLDKHAPEVRNWLIGYFSSLSVKDCLGERNLNRIRRRVRDELNEMLWPKARPRVDEILLKDFTVS